MSPRLHSWTSLVFIPAICLALLWPLWMLEAGSHFDFVCIVGQPCGPRAVSHIQRGLLGYFYEGIWFDGAVEVKHVTAIQPLQLFFTTAVTAILLVISFFSARSGIRHRRTYRQDASNG
jgi:hypothetical protein